MRRIKNRDCRWRRYRRYNTARGFDRAQCYRCGALGHWMINCDLGSESSSSDEEYEEYKYKVKKRRRN